MRTDAAVSRETQRQTWLGWHFAHGRGSVASFIVRCTASRRNPVSGRRWLLVSRRFWLCTSWFALFYMKTLRAFLEFPCFLRVRCLLLARFRLYAKLRLRCVFSVFLFGAISLVRPEEAHYLHCLVRSFHVIARCFCFMVLHFHFVSVDRPCSVGLRCFICSLPFLRFRAAHETSKTFKNTRKLSPTET